VSAEPLWSVMIPTYRTEPAFLCAAIESVLACNISAAEMQIEVVNDGDASEVAALTDKFGDRVTFTTNARNLGAPANYDECIRRARGVWVHLLHADDAIFPTFYDAYADAIASTPSCVMAAGPAVVIDGDDRWIGMSRAVRGDSAEAIASWHPCNFAATVVRRSAYDEAGPFAVPLAHAADWEMWTRIATLGPVAWVDRPHAYYRRHSASDSARVYATTAYLDEMRAAIAVNVARFENADARRRVHASAMVVASDYALGVAAEQLAAGRRRVAIRNALAGVRMRANLSTFGRAGDTIVRALADRVLP
jgi:glycosyltransferase involved in cell wall biosynthesis